MQVVGAPLARCSDTAAVPSCRARPSASFLGNARALSTHRATPARRQGGGGSSLVVAGLFGLGLPELVVIGGVAALAFGPAKLPELGKSLGKTVKSFQTAAKARGPASSTAALSLRRRPLRTPLAPPLALHSASPLPA